MMCQKKLTGVLFFVFVFFFPVIAPCQEEFSFPMYFEDSVGNKDTIVYGYDENATIFLDSAYGEVDISDKPWDSEFEVRISVSAGFYTDSYFQTKKQVTKMVCDTNTWTDSMPLNHMVEIVTKNWPVTASWDNELFNSSCLEKAFFTGIISDALGSSAFGLYLKDTSSITFDKQKFGYPLYGHEFEGESGVVDTVSHYWITFYDYSIFRHSLNIRSEHFSRRPNPPYIVSGLFPIARLGAGVSELILYSLKGKKLDTPTMGEHLDMSSLKTGIYFLTYRNQAGSRIKHILFKQ